jgi:carboxyl-terminal processing protease
MEGMMNDTQSMSQFVRRIQIGLLAIILVGVGGIGGYSLGQYDAKKATGHDDVAFNSFWQAWDIIDSNYFGDKDATKRVDGAIAGMVESLGDPHTLYLEAKQDKLFRSDLEGSFSGIGAELLVKSGVLMIDAVLDDSPAQRSGLKANDALIEIDGVKTSGLSFVDAIDHIRGEKGTTVTLTVGREGSDEALKVAVVRDTITVKSVKTDTLGENKDIAYIKISQFGEDTTALFAKALTDALDTSKKGLVLDLRNNPGGYLQGAVDDIGMLLPSKVSSDKDVLSGRVAVLERDRDGRETKTYAGTRSIAPELPVVVLVDAGSASASEIFAGAMKDYARAKVVGVKTYGKGSVQNLLKLKNGGSIKVTIAKWFTPLGTGIDKIGIEPDVVIALPDGVTSSTTDVQVQKALELLGTK